MSDVPPAETFDVFLSHDSGDKPWVRNLRDELARLGLRAWLDEAELPGEDNFVRGLGAAGLLRCRFLVRTPRGCSDAWRNRVTWSECRGRSWRSSIT